MRLYVGVTDKEYDMEIPGERFRLRADLQSEGFFSITENKRFYPMFDEESPKKTDLKDLLHAMQFFQLTVQKADVTKH